MCYRFRMNFGRGGKDFASEVWGSGYVGIWHGPWAPEDLYAAADSCRTSCVKPKALADALNSAMLAKGSSSKIGTEGAAAALTFDGLGTGTWVFTCFDHSVHLAQIANEKTPLILPQFGCNGETFKARPIENKKSFRLSELPPSFLLLPTAGRGSVHKVPSCSVLLRLLMQSDTAEDVADAFDALPWDQWVTALGPKGWETLCLGYLVQAYGFLPTGLSVGGTLAEFDIVGSLRSGELVYAQCKGDPARHAITQGEEEAFASIRDARKFFFARSGVSRSLDGVIHFDQAAIVEWLAQSEKGAEYLRLLRPKMRASAISQRDERRAGEP
jgi:hypothetical protein